MFKFNFLPDAQDEKEVVEKKPVATSSTSTGICREHFAQDNCEMVESVQFLLDGGKVVLKHVNSQAVTEKLLGKGKCGLLEKTAHDHTDLIAGVYEGGMKIWECSHDLVNFLHTSQLVLKDKRVLELGCGASLPGIYCIKAGGAASAVFQDYNEEVIDHVTIPNVLLNCSTDKARFFSGDWSHFKSDTPYDIILTSETIYNEDNYPKLMAIFKQCLDKDGRVLVATKTHYFGVGGGARQFEVALAKEKEFTCETVFSSDCGVKREILSIKRML